MNTCKWKKAEKSQLFLFLVLEILKGVGQTLEKKGNLISKITHCFLKEDLEICFASIL